MSRHTTKTKKTKKKTRPNTNTTTNMNTGSMFDGTSVGTFIKDVTLLGIGTGTIVGITIVFVNVALNAGTSIVTWLGI